MCRGKGWSRAMAALEQLSVPGRVWSSDSSPGITESGEKHRPSAFRTCIYSAPNWRLQSSLGDTELCDRLLGKPVLAAPPCREAVCSEPPQCF